MHANAALTMRSGARKKITRFPPVEYIKIPLYYYEVAFLAKILRSCRRKGMDVLTGSYRPTITQDTRGAHGSLGGVATLIIKMHVNIIRVPCSEA